MKKGRHRRFEEARKLKQSGPGAFDLGFGERSREPDDEEDEYAALAEKYGVTFDDDDDAANYGVADEIARRVMLAGGKVLAVRSDDVPGSGSVAAILRYAV